MEKQLLKLDTSTALGPDSVPSWVLKEFSDLLAGSVAATYNSSLREGQDPPSWHAAHVRPLPKKKPPDHIETDPRPISFTAALCKEMEEFVVKWVWDKTELTQTNTALLRSHPLHMPSLTCYSSVIQANMHRSSTPGYYCLTSLRHWT